MIQKTMCKPYTYMRRESQRVFLARSSKVKSAMWHELQVALLSLRLQGLMPLLHILCCRLLLLLLLPTAAAAQPASSAHVHGPAVARHLEAAVDDQTLRDDHVPVVGAALVAHALQRAGREDSLEFVGGTGMVVQQGRHA